MRKFLVVVALFAAVIAIRYVTYSFSDNVGELFVLLSMPLVSGAAYLICSPIRHAALRMVAAVAMMVGICIVDLRILYALRVLVFQYIPSITFMEVAGVYWVTVFPFMIVGVVIIEYWQRKRQNVSA